MKLFSIRITINFLLQRLQKKKYLENFLSASSINLQEAATIINTTQSLQQLKF